MAAVHPVSTRERGCETGISLFPYTPSTHQVVRDTYARMGKESSAYVERRERVQQL